MLARRWRAFLDTALQDAGLTEAAWAPLMHLHRLGDGVQQKILAARIGIDTSTLVRLIDILEHHPQVDIELIPVTVLWGRSPDKEDSWLKLLFTDTWATPGTVKQLVNIGLHGRQSYLEFHQGQSLRQLIEFANTNPRDYAQLKDDVVMLYPVPTVWSSHVYIALSDKGRRVVDAMMDPLIQQNAWEKHGFRTGVNAASVDTSTLPVQGVAPVVSRIIQMPDSGTMETIIQALE